MKYERQFGSFYSRNVKQEKPHMVYLSIFQQRKKISVAGQHLISKPGGKI